MIKRILLTGLPGCGKTTLARKIADFAKAPKAGFFTFEIREKGERKGFEIESLSGKKAVFSHVGIDSPYRVSKYKVDIQSFEKIAIPEMERAIVQKSFLIIDEIGKMELFSAKFKELVLDVFELDIPLLATILSKPHPFCDRLKKAPNTQLFFLKKDNHEKIFNQIINKFAFVE